MNFANHNPAIWIRLEINSECRADEQSEARVG
jgi:hypothetical protein